MTTTKEKFKGRIRNIFSDYKWWVWLLLAAVMFFGIVGRFYDLDDPPLDFHPTRQLHSMLIARGFYFESLDNVPQNLRDVAIRQKEAEGFIEPPIIEYLTAKAYKAVGSDDLRIPRILSIAFWTFGGLGLFLLIKEIMSGQAAVVGLAYYMVLPYALIASRSFQPEPLLTAAIIWSWWGMLKWQKNKTWKWTIIAGLLAGFAIFVKSPAIFFVLPAWIGLILADQGFVKAIKSSKIWTIFILTILPFAIYHVFGMYILGFLRGQMSLRFFPNLWTDIFHYLSWKDMIDKTLGIELFLLGIIGTLIIKPKPARIMILCIWIGYFLYGMTFSYHIVTHDYYQIPFVPVVGLGLAAIAEGVIHQISGKKGFFLTILTGVLLFWMSYNFWDTRMTLKHAKYQGEPSFWSELGTKLQDKSVIAITEDYGMRLAYWGWKGTTYWMSSADFSYRELGGNTIDRLDLFKKEVEGKEIFLVTNFSQLDRQSDIKEILYEGFPILEETERYIMFDLINPY